ncbi:MAG: hydantoinase/oxoprolinase N-terminal domain-containing protein [Halobacteriota archaeon]
MNGYRLGIDVGGTNTDAVILDAEDTPIAQTKRPTIDEDPPRFGE